MTPTAIFSERARLTTDRPVREALRPGVPRGVEVRRAGTSEAISPGATGAIEDILLLVHDDVGQEARLRVALDIALAVTGHVTCLDVTPTDPLFASAWSGAAGAALRKAERRREAENRGRLMPRLVRAGVSWEWIDTIDHAAPAMAKAGAFADLVITSCSLLSLPPTGMRDWVTPLFGSSKGAILVVPEMADGLDPGGTALIAWDGSNDVFVALEAAMPMLRLARSVVLLEVDDGTISAPAEAAAIRLAGSGIRPWIMRDTGSAPDILAAQVATGHFAYLVMGGPACSRLHEALLGAVSRRLLGKSPVPLLLAQRAER
jgi:nucleotide-binding universal stress UspA family protein